MTTVSNESLSTFSLPASDERVLITDVNSNDVLMGRGLHSTEFIGNKRFRSLVQERKEEYCSARRHELKRNIAEDVFNRVHELGGRFLQSVPLGDGPDQEAYYEVKKIAAIEKCKQTLRSNPRRKQRQKANPPSTTEISATAVQENTQTPRKSVGLPPDSVAIPHRPADTLARIQSGCLERAVIIGQAASSYKKKEQYQFPSFKWTSGLASTQSGPFLVSDQYSAPDQTTTTPPPSPPPSPLPVTPLKEDSLDVKGNDYTLDEAALDVISDGEAAEVLLSILEQPHVPKFSELQLEEEQAALSDKERAAALADLFGKSCAISIEPNAKRIRKDLDRGSVKFLVRQMRLQLEQIPPKKKQSLIEAQRKCHPDEFSDARLERFLRCEGMNTKFGAERFVKYWEARRRYFGTDKYILPMTLKSGAFSDEDLIAMEAGVLRILPGFDCYGRQIRIIAPQKDTREGYTLENLLRALWYTMEVLSHENTDANSGFIEIGWTKDMTVWDYDVKFWNHYNYLCIICGPVKRLAGHVCCLPRITAKFLKPLYLAVLDRDGRARTLWHTASDDQILDVLSEYGMSKDVLPTEMGGTYRLEDESEWIANRRAIELGEI